MLASFIFIYSLRVTPTSFSWWFFNGVWVTSSRLKSLGLFSVFWQLLIMLLFGWSPLVLEPLWRPVPLICSLCQKHQSQLVQTSPSSFIFFLQFPCKDEVLILLFTFFRFYSGISRTAKSTILKVLFFCWLSLGLVFWPSLGDPVVCQSPIFPFWGCRIHRVHLCRGVRPPPNNECPRSDTKQSDGDVPVMLELWGIWSAPLFPSFPGPLWSGVVATDMCPIYGLNRTKPCFLHYTDFCI